MAMHEGVKEVTRESFREHDHKHPYVLKYTGCGHGRLYSEPCVDCEIVGLHEQHRDAARTIARVRDRLRELGAPMPGFTSGGRRAGVAAAQQCADAIRAGAKEPRDG